ncbi:GIN domain-containing protein [Bacteroides caecigallinarum]|uniref:GIN domain-containing protein n=1 Tax=Bacteroides caecigallinarum TaxID=1411144 RepID=UPI00195CF093|nr:DUF2807 domain-containing protein [Bacteroides caecigallinarum]MBM6883315.1 DUF2807 domain-containing protein [Bacteroides caecigallinarum]
MKLNSKLSILIISAVTSLTATSCMISTATSKNEATSIYDVNTSYKSLSVRSAIKVEYRHDIDKLQIIADSSILSKIKVNYDEDDIEIYASSFKSPFNVTALVPASKELENIEIEGASSFSSDKEIEAEKLDIEVSGASKFNANINCQSLKASVSGASSASIGGEAMNAEISVSGASKLSSENLNTDYADIDISGASKAEIICNKNITGNVSGASKLSFGGTAKSDVSTSGASKVSRK